MPGPGESRDALQPDEQERIQLGLEAAEVYYYSFFWSSLILCFCGFKNTFSTELAFMLEAAYYESYSMDFE